MKRITWGIVPSDLNLPKPYRMVLSAADLPIVAAIVNQGIDSHLEAVFTRQNGREVFIEDTKSMKTFLRRCVESQDDDTESFASDIMSTLGYEWV